MEEKTRRVIAIIITTSFCLITLLLIIIPYVFDLVGYSGVEEVRMEYLDKVISVFTGIIGVIIGYYFRGRIEN